MKSKITTDKIESKKIDKARKVLLFCGVGLIIVSILKFMLAGSQQLSSLGWWTDIILLATLPIYFLVRSQKQLSDRSGQFVEWTVESIIFKLKNETSPKIIQRDKIKNISIHLNTIEIITADDQKFLLDISDFDKYDDRLRIKDNFEREMN